jgi:hypothetical protein
LRTRPNTLPRRAFRRDRHAWQRVAEAEHRNIS